MDSSNSSSSASLDAVRGVPRTRRKPTPEEVAILLFEEADGLWRDQLLPLVTDGLETNVYRVTGVRVDGGRKTLPFYDLPLPNGMKAVAVASAVQRHGRVYYEKHGNTTTQWGILLLARDSDGYPHWLWALVWDPWDKPDNSCVELDVETLTGLLTIPREDGGYPALNWRTVYGDFEQMLGRKLHFYRKIESALVLRAARTLERNNRLKAMLPS